MNKSLFFLSLVILPFVSSQALADRVTTAWFKIQEIGVDGNGPAVVVAPSGVTTNCTNNTLQWYVGVSEMNDYGYNSATSIALAAYMGDKEVKIEYEDSTPSCYAYNIRMR